LLLLLLLYVFNGYIINTNNKDDNGDRVLRWGGVSSCPRVKFDFDYVHLSELIVEYCLEIETRGLFEWSKLMLFA
jgi:hypothetical protein